MRVTLCKRGPRTKHREIGQVGGLGPVVSHNGYGSSKATLELTLEGGDVYQVATEMTVSELETLHGLIGASLRTIKEGS